jgi:hypothetical protein
MAFTRTDQHETGPGPRRGLHDREKIVRKLSRRVKAKNTFFGAFFAAAKNRAFRSKSSQTASRFAAGFPLQSLARPGAGRNLCLQNRRPLPAILSLKKSSKIRKGAVQ